MFKIFLSLSFSGTLLIIILFLFKPLYKNKLSKRWQYYIWLIVIARLLLPFTFENTVVGNIFSLEFEQSKNFNFTSYNTNSNNFVTEVYVNNENNFLQRIFQNIGFIWIIGVVILFIRKVTVYQSFITYMKVGQTEISNIRIWEEFGKLVDQYGFNKPISIYTNNLISSPLLIGFFKPRIILPTIELSEGDFKYTILHELTHYKRLDMFYKWLVQLTICLHWFNPFVHFMGKEINKACELSCDEAVMRRLHTTDYKSYGDTLLNTFGNGGTYKSSISSITLNESKELLKERLNAIINFNRNNKMTSSFSVIGILILLTCFIFAGAYNNVNFPVEQTYFIDNSSSIIDTNFQTSYLINELESTEIGFNDVDSAALTLLDYCGNWELTENYIPNMSKEGIDRLVELYNRKNHYNLEKKNASDYYNMKGNSADIRALNLIEANGMWIYSCVLFPYMTNNGIDKIVDIYNDRHQGSEKKIAYDYYN